MTTMEFFDPHAEIVLDSSILPQGDSIMFEESIFFRRYTSLPSPADVRAAAEEQHPTQSTIVKRPLPVEFPSLNLIVKYGNEITIAEGQCLWAIGRLLQDSVPVPELYGWDTEGGQVFLYMELIHGVTLEERYSSLSHEEKTIISLQLRDMVRSFRRLRQKPADPFIGK